MKKLNKFLLLVAFSAVAFSCSKDDDATPEKKLEDVTPSLAASSSAITIPSAMANSTDTYALQANLYVSQANNFSSYAQYFKPPQGSVKSSTPITIASGRRAATQTEYVVYTWTDPQGSGASVAYQVSEQSGKYVFEVFLKLSPEDEWMRYIDVEETKDGSEGLMRIYASMFGDDSVLFTYSWKRSGDTYDFVVKTSDEETQLSVNTKTKAGSLKYFYGGELGFTMTWDAAGNGEWVHYEEGGEVYERGSWKV